MIHTAIGNLGHLFVIISFVSSLIAAFAFFRSTGNPLRKDQWLQNGRIAFFTHTIAVIGIMVSLYVIISNHYYEYHYAWSHSSNQLPVYYMISSFWEGQEGSFLLWMFWHAILGVILIFTNKFWEGPVMTIFSMVQAFLASMILGVIIFDAKIGSTPFILLREVMDAPIFQTDPNFIPQDGSGLNPLLQNYWMVIHPPTLFLGFATTLIPFSYCISGLWIGKYREWIRPALPWAIFSAAVLCLGILMGAYWAYETLSFGGYWSWDPVENAVYVPWLILVAAIHTMITFRNSNTALKTSIILVIATFILILYSTFLTRSGVLGDASVHAFTDLGMNGQLLIYLFFFLMAALVLAIVRWKKIPASEKDISSYSREFWIFLGASTLALMGFQVLLPTSIPAFNSLMESFGFVSVVAPPTDPITYYSKFQLWFAVALALLSGTGQFFWWKKIDKSKLRKDLSIPLILTLVIGGILILLTRVSSISFLVLLTAGVYSVVANSKILLRVWKTSPGLSGGSIAHIGVAMMLIGILYSAGYSKIISSNRSGISITGDSEFERENVRLIFDDPVTMGTYQLLYKGQRIKAKGVKGYIRKSDVAPTTDPFHVVAKREIESRKQTIQKGDTLNINPENTYYEIEYTNENQRKFTLYPRIQMNEQMGGMTPSPGLKRYLARDLYTHINGIPNPEEAPEWTELDTVVVSIGEQFFANDYVAVIESINPLEPTDGIDLSRIDVGVKARIRIQGKSGDYYMEPIFVISGNQAGRIPDVLEELGVRLTFLTIFPETDRFMIGINTTPKDYVILKAIEMPYINILWTGTFILMIGFGVAITRRYKEFRKMRDKEQE